MRNTSLSELIKLAEQAKLSDNQALDVLGQCLLVYALLHPNATPDLKAKVAKRLAKPARVQRKPKANDVSRRR